MPLGAWTLKHGIAAVIRVGTPDGEEWTAMYMNHKGGIEWTRNYAVFASPAIPQWVIDRVNRRFGEVFAILPLHKRSDYCSHTPFEIKEDDDPTEHA